MTFNSLLNEIVSLITNNFESKNISLLLRTIRYFNTILLVKFYDITLTYIRIIEETSLLWIALHNCEAIFKSLL